MFEDCEPNLIRTVDMQDTMPCRYLQLHLYAEVVPSKGQILMDTDHTLRYDDHKMEWYLKAIPTSIGGLAILIVFVAVVAGIALKCRQTSINSSDTTPWLLPAILLCYTLLLLMIILLMTMLPTVFQ